MRFNRREKEYNTEKKEKDIGLTTEITESGTERTEMKNENNSREKEYYTKSKEKDIGLTTEVTESCTERTEMKRENNHREKKIKPQRERRGMENLDRKRKSKITEIKRQSPLSLRKSQGTLRLKTIKDE